MVRNRLKIEYFEWMCKLVQEAYLIKIPPYKKLLKHLNDIEFSYCIPMDGNRAEDGVDLRYRFGRERSYDDAMIAAYLDNSPCSVLEMMIALAIRCEEHIMDDPDIGNRTGKWFWNMVSSLGLASMNDAEFNKDYVDDVISKFLNRKYHWDGRGGLFTVKNCMQDLRSVEIWYQMCCYLDHVL